MHLQFQTFPTLAVSSLLRESVVAEVVRTLEVTFVALSRLPNALLNGCHFSRHLSPLLLLLVPLRVRETRRNMIRLVRDACIYKSNERILLFGTGTAARSLLAWVPVPVPPNLPSSTDSQR